MNIIEDANYKVLKSPNINYVFDKVNGHMAQWGATYSEDPLRCEYGPTIADIEITTSCSGPAGKLCPFCYKSNNPDGHNMTFAEFQHIFHQIPRTLTQIAFGIDASATSNPDLFKMMDYCRTNSYNQVIPNLTVADLADSEADTIASLAGATAVSYYAHAGKDVCYDTVHKLTSRGMTQVNIHFMLSEQTLADVDLLITDIQTDPRLANLNALVFLSLKQKGRGSKYTACSTPTFKTVIDKLLAACIPFGFDSCSAPKFLQAVKDRPDYATLLQMAEPCESTAFSLYVNERCKVSPCSFMENTPGWTTGFDLLKVNSPEDFLTDVWNSKEFLSFGKSQQACITCGKGCSYYEI